MIRDLIFKTVDDWFIYATDAKGDLWYVNTELWPEWQNVPPDEEDYNPNAVAQYMLPIAFKRWNMLDWRRAK